MSHPASAGNIPNNNVRLSKACWQDDDINTTCHQTNMPIQLRQVMSPNPHSILKELIAQSSLEMCEGSVKQSMETIHCLPNQCPNSRGSLGVSRATKRRIETRILEMDRSNPSSIHGTEATNHPAGSLSENDTSTNKSDHHDVISEPVARPEIRRMTPSDDVESDIDDLHRWYKRVRQRSNKLEALNLPNQFKAGN